MLDLSHLLHGDTWHDLHVAPDPNWIKEISSGLSVATPRGDIIISYSTLKGLQKGFESSYGTHRVWHALRGANFFYQSHGVVVALLLDPVLMSLIPSGF